MPPVEQTLVLSIARASCYRSPEAYIARYHHSGASPRATTPTQCSFLRATRGAIAGGRDAISLLPVRAISARRHVAATFGHLAKSDATWACPRRRAGREARHGICYAIRDARASVSGCTGIPAGRRAAEAPARGPSTMPHTPDKTSTNRRLSEWPRLIRRLLIKSGQRVACVPPRSSTPQPPAKRARRCTPPRAHWHIFYRDYFSRAQRQSASSPDFAPDHQPATVATPHIRASISCRGFAPPRF